MRKKICIRCRRFLPLDEFYSHKQMADGRLNACKSCVKKSSAERHARIEADPLAREDELDRQREKARRYREQGKKPVSRVSAKERMRRTRLEHPEAVRARNLVQHAKRRGDLIPQPCEVCGSEDVHAHHDDYSKPLEVRWLCSAHHASVDNIKRKAERLGHRSL